MSTDRGEQKTDPLRSIQLSMCISHDEQSRKIIFVTKSSFMRRDMNLIEAYLRCQNMLISTGVCIYLIDSYINKYKNQLKMSTTRSTNFPKIQKLIMGDLENI